MDYPQWAYAGWDPASAQADWQAKGKNLGLLQQVRGYGPSQPSTPQTVSPTVTQPASQDPVALAKQLQQFNIEAFKPQVSQYQTQLTGVPSIFAEQKRVLEAEKEPTKTRYQNIIDELKRREKVQTGAAELAASREFGQRGIPLSSGVFADFLRERTSPISELFTGQTKDVGLAQAGAERELQNLILGIPTAQTEAENKIRLAIAQLKAGSPAEAIKSAVEYTKEFASKAKTITSSLDDIWSKINTTPAPTPIPAPIPAPTPAPTPARTTPVTTTPPVSLAQQIQQQFGYTQPARNISQFGLNPSIFSTLNPYQKYT